jgi:pimeloyl-ACP methyl ester carboxylesterase
MSIELATRFGAIRAATGGRSFDPDLPAVVFLHGAGLDHTAWTSQSRWFAHHGRSVLAIDLPGHGGSGGRVPTTIGGLAEVVIDVLDAAGLARTALVGHSLGALIALETAARYPERVRALGLVGAAARIPVNAALLEASQAALPKAISMIVSWGFGPRSVAQSGPVADRPCLAGAGPRRARRAPCRSHRLSDLYRRPRIRPSGAVPDGDGDRRTRPHDPGGLRTRTG